MKKKTNILEVCNELKKKHSKIEYNMLIKEIMLLTGWREKIVIEWIKTMKKIGLIKRLDQNSPGKMEFIFMGEEDKELK